MSLITSPSTTLEPPTMTPNQLKKRSRRERIKAEQQIELTQSLQSDPLCQRILRQHQLFQEELGGRWRWSLRHEANDRNEDDGTSDTSCTPTKKPKLESDVPRSSSIIMPIDASIDCSSTTPTPCISSCSFLVYQPGIAVVIDQACQICSSYTHHTLDRMGELVPNRSPTSSLDLFRLDAPYQQLSIATTTTATATAPLSTSDLHVDETKSTTAPNQTTTPNHIWRNDTNEDAIMSHQQGRFVMPPHSIALMSDINDAPQQLLAVRPESGFRLIVMDPPWECKSVRRSQRYPCMENHQLLQLPIPQLLSSTVTSLVAIWVTNNPTHSSFIRNQLFPLWNLTHVATWHWIKVCDDGRMVFPLHPAHDRQHRKPYEQILIGQTSQPVAHVVDTSTASFVSHSTLSSSANDAAVDQSTKKDHARSSTETSSTASPAPVLVLPSEFLLFSVPGTNQHSRKPQLQDIFASLASLPLVGSSLELFARNLVRSTVSWGNEPLKFQHTSEQCQRRTNQTRTDDEMR